MNKPKPPNEVIVVEGKADSQRLKMIYGPAIKIIETNGSAVSRKLYPELKKAAEQFGVIIFTDPDFQGERIRRIVEEVVPEAKHAYLKADEAKGTQPNQSLGVEHASAEAIQRALNDVISDISATPSEAITTTLMMELGLTGTPEAMARREYINDYFRLGHNNSKQLRRKLNDYGIQINELVDALNRWEGGENEA